MPRNLLIPFVCSIVFLCSGCPDQGQTTTIVVTSDFTNGPLGWEAEATDFTVEQEAGIAFQSGIEELPAELSVEGDGFFLSSNNGSDDTFMFLKRRIGTAQDLLPNQTYQLRYTITLASNAPSGCSGIGGAPGESVFIKVGASVAEPERVVEDGFISLNVDKGDQNNNGQNATVIGDIANGDACDDPENAPYVSIEREGDHEETVTTDENGNLWLFVGTESGFEGTTAIYYQSIVVELVRVNN